MTVLGPSRRALSIPPLANQLGNVGGFGGRGQIVSMPRCNQRDRARSTMARSQ
jgi:hypothetical protein